MTDDRGPDPCMCGTPYPCRANHTPDPEWRAMSSAPARRAALAATRAAVDAAKRKREEIR